MQLVIFWATLFDTKDPWPSRKTLYCKPDSKVMTPRQASSWVEPLWEASWNHFVGVPIKVRRKFQVLHQEGVLPKVEPFWGFQFCIMSSKHWSSNDGLPEFGFDEMQEPNLWSPSLWLAKFQPTIWAARSEPLPRFKGKHQFGDQWAERIASKFYSPSASLGSIQLWWNSCGSRWFDSKCPSWVTREVNHSAIQDQKGSFNCPLWQASWMPIHGLNLRFPQTLSGMIRPFSNGNWSSPS